VQSTLGEGSVFSFTLPLETSADAPAPDADADLDIRVEVEGGARVLVVDDQESNRLVLREMLERVGFLVDEAQDGKEAFAKAVEVPPAIVFMDIKMPVMDGYEAVALFKKDPRTKAAMVFALTASAFSHDEARIDAAGFDGFLAKPFKQSSLYRLVAERGGVPVVTKRMAGSRDTATPGVPEPEDFGAIGEETRRGIEGAALINDFASLAALAESLRGVAPRVAAALEAAASSYDEAAVEKLMIIMRNKGDGDGR
jgi:CheY-like chemotaxis protein